MHQYTLNLKEFFLKYSKDSLKLGKIQNTDGSTYKKKGAIKLVHSSGSSIGLLSGGCHEAFIDESILSLKDGDCFEVDTTTDTDLYFGSQTGCQGKLTIEVFELKKETPWKDFASQHIRSWINPLIVIIGSGPDTEPLTSIFQTLRWPTKLLDFRTKYLKPNHQDYEMVAEQDLKNYKLPTTHDAVAVILMSHHYHYDLTGFEFALLHDANFIGVLGPKARKQKMISEIKQTTSLNINENIIYGPVGTEKLGYDEEAIALSIAAQLKKEFFH